MALSDDLVAYYSMEEPFEQAISAVNSVPPNHAPLLTINDPGSGTGGIFTQSVAGKIGKAAEGYIGVQSVYLKASEHAINILNKNKTFACWVNLTPGGRYGDSAIVSKAGASLEYRLTKNGATSQWEVRSATQSVPSSVPAVEGQWTFIVFWFDLAQGKVFIRVNNNPAESGTFTVALQAGSSFVVANDAVAVDELGIWDRILTAEEIDELYNGGDGLSYEEIIDGGEPPACREVDCCEDDVFAYAATAGAGQPFDTMCEPLPRVIFEPVSGSVVIMPTLVVLRSDNPDAVIHYTTDGTAPNSNSTVYSGPITVESPITTVRALAVVNGCPSGPEATAQYQQWTPAAHFTYDCATTDRSGQWGAFAGDGNPDYNWELQIQFSAITGVKHFSVMQLKTTGEFAGAAWSTKEYIFPWEYDATKQFRAFPLVVWIGGLQQNLGYLDDYSATLGNFAIAPHTLALHGQPFFSGGSLPSDWLFKLLITFSDGTTLARLVDKTCDALPAALCPIPIITALTPQCGPPLRIDVTFSIPVGSQYAVMRRPGGTLDPSIMLTSGIVATDPETYQDATVLAGQPYDYWLSSLPPGCATHRTSVVYPATAIGNPIVGIAASPSTIDSGGSTTVSWSSSQVSGNVTIAPTIGVQPGNVAGSQVVSPASTTTYTITGANVCGTVGQDDFTVTVNPPATCGAVQPAIVAINGYVGTMFLNGGCGPLLLGGGTAWNGRFRNNAGTCNFFILQIPGGYHFDSVGDGNRLLYLLGTTIVQGGGLWTLSVAAQTASGVPVTMWRGTKASGDTPVGTYTRTTGCSATPGSLSVAAV